MFLGSMSNQSNPGVLVYPTIFPTKHMEKNSHPLPFSNVLHICMKFNRACLAEASVNSWCWTGKGGDGMLSEASFWMGANQACTCSPLQPQAANSISKSCLGIVQTDITKATTRLPLTTCLLHVFCTEKVWRNARKGSSERYLFESFKS